MSAISADTEFQALRALSADLGRNRFRTQGAGGNTSIKRDGAMWIKASGRQLAEALERDIMLPVTLEDLKAAALQNDSAADSAAAFVIDGLNPAQLSPSIETSVHAIIPHAVVAHIHWVETIALAVRDNASELIGERLRGLAEIVWSFVPYRRPGLPLAHAIIESAAPHSNVLILGNHGLVISGASVGEVAYLTERVCNALSAEPRATPLADISALENLAAGSKYRLPRHAETHALALDPASLALARGASLYPDHVIFLGAGAVEAPDIETGWATRLEGGPDRPPLMLVLPGKRVVLHHSASAAADGMAIALVGVFAVYTLSVIRKP